MTIEDSVNGCCELGLLLPRAVVERRRSGDLAGGLVRFLALWRLTTEPLRFARAVRWHSGGGAGHDP